MILRATLPGQTCAALLALPALSLDWVFSDSNKTMFILADVPIWSFNPSTGFSLILTALLLYSKQITLA
jgi:hypothetical protein